MNILKRLGWRRDLPDRRDALYGIPFFRTLPPAVDLRDGFPPVYDQGELGSCTANAAAGALQFLQRKQGFPVVMPSRLFCYYHTREREGTVDSDAGGSIRDTIQVCADLGVPPEADWPYEIARFTEDPDPRSHADAIERQLLKYARVTQSRRALKSVLYEGFPVLYGFSVFASMQHEQVAETGIVPMPEPDDELLGGHAVVLVGYDDATRRFRFRNSWGNAWGDRGWGQIPYEYLTDPDMAADFWIMKLIEG